MSQFEHQRHKPPTVLARPRELLLVLPPLRSNVNFSRIVRIAGCCGLKRLVACGQPRLDPKIARLQPGDIHIETRRTLLPVLRQVKSEGHELVGLEQTSGSQSLYEFRFQRRTALIAGNERTGLPEDILQQLDRVVEIPVYGMPYSYNVATAVALALYEYCRQFPTG
jgi:tRNA G18 (ribose-2'-O)-methylase SpoU